MQKLVLGIDFGRAMVDHFGLPRDKVDVDLSVNAGRNDIFGATLTIALTADDLAAIAQRMPGVTKPPPAVVPPVTAPQPRHGEVWIDRKNVRSKGVTDFDVWMRDRTDTEHAAFMARTSRNLNLQESPCAN